MSVPSPDITMKPEPRPSLDTGFRTPPQATEAACARCPFYVPKGSSRGQLLAVKNGIDQMLEQLASMSRQ
ncbi:hypothetical protein [Streptomyces lutosisoli]|uniref:Uncharacterized protein n=1 Tax=Streptomyces lutosisoli TaxID=2665721 RepID=A0ABW2W290_9ACTN